MDSLSANTLFHFTDSVDNIENILINEFCPKYSLEDFGAIAHDLSYEVAVPMICFCDIPLSQIKNHIENYGNYAIGLKKVWGISKKVNPVLYLYRDAATSNYIRGLVLELKKKKDEDIPDESNYFNTMGLIKFIKPYEGKLWKNGKYYNKTIRFYDEREWRYIPEIKDEDIGILDKKIF